MLIIEKCNDDDRKIFLVAILFVMKEKDVKTKQRINRGYMDRTIKGKLFFTYQIII